MTEILGKTAFITGGSNGIGLGIAKAFVRRGANVMIAGQNKNRLDNAVKELRDIGAAEVDGVVCNVANIEAVRAAAEATISRFGNVHLLVNNAGVSLKGRVGEIAIEDWKWIVDINLMGVVHGVEVFTPLIRATGEGGHIINTSSITGHLAGAGFGPYMATKFAVVGYSESLRADLESENIFVSCFCPGFVKTDIAKKEMRRPSGGLDESFLQTDPLQAMVKDGLSAEPVGEWMAECVEENRLHIFTDPFFMSLIEARTKGILADYQAIVDDGRFTEACELAAARRNP